MLWGKKKNNNLFILLLVHASIVSDVSGRKITSHVIIVIQHNLAEF